MYICVCAYTRARVIVCVCMSPIYTRGEPVLRGYYDSDEDDEEEGVNSAGISVSAAVTGRGVYCAWRRWRVVGFWGFGPEGRKKKKKREKKRQRRVRRTVGR